MKVMVGTPSYDGNFCEHYAMSLVQTAGELSGAGIPMSMALLVGNPFVDAARNGIVDQFLKSDCTDLLFVDSDVGWDASKVTRVLSYEQEIVVGLVPKRNKDREDEFHSNALTGKIEDGLFECFEAPTAFMRIKRSVFEKLADHYPDFRMQQDAGKAVKFFHTGTADADWGEDIYFCRRWSKLGSLWVDSDITFTHTGRKTWRGNFFEHAVKSGLLQTA